MIVQLLQYQDVLHEVQQSCKERLLSSYVSTNEHRLTVWLSVMSPACGARAETGVCIALLSR